MRIGMPLSYSGQFEEAVQQVVALEEVGIDIVFLPEAYTFDSVSQLGYLAAKTSRVELGTSILNVYSRTPALLAMTAAGMDYVSGGRFNLGVGASGPQVVEGFHGLPFKNALGRTREVVEICRKVWNREAVEFQGRHFHVPLGPDHGGSGLGKPLKLINRPVRSQIPVTLAALGEKSVELAAELFEGWHPIFYLPEVAEQVFGESLTRGAGQRSSHLPQLDVIAESYLRITDDPVERERAMQQVREHVALYVGGMGARGKNFYATLISRFGFEREVLHIQELFLAGEKEAAARAVPDELVLGLAVIGSESEVKERVAAFVHGGVTTLNVRPVAASIKDRINDIARLKTVSA